MGMFPLYVELHPQIWEMFSNIFIGSFHVIFSCPHVRPNTSKPYTPPCAFGINTHAIDIHFTFYPCHSICKAFSSAGISPQHFGLRALEHRRRRHSTVPWKNYLQTIDFGSFGKFALVAAPYWILTACYGYTNFLQLEDQTTTVPKDCNFTDIKGYR